jgi:hypothetical protein
MDDRFGNDVGRLLEEFWRNHRSLFNGSDKDGEIEKWLDAAGDKAGNGSETAVASGSC